MIQRIIKRIMLRRRRSRRLWRSKMAKILIIQKNRSLLKIKWSSLSVKKKTLLLRMILLMLKKIRVNPWLIPP
jgi:hypothetical protein